MSNDLPGEVHRALERIQRAYETAVLADAERSLAAISAQGSGKPPAPLEFHPFYRAHTWLLDWLNGVTFVGQHVIEVPRPARWTPFAETDPTAFELPPDNLRLTRQTAWGRAPYVGNPFVYTWQVASDQYGRWVAGERTVQYV